ncbi:MAG: C25 family peptidase propeptide domain-containing protein, partial [bacterium]
MNGRTKGLHWNRRSSTAALFLYAALAFGALLWLPINGQAELVSFENNWGQAGFNLVRQDGAGVELIFSIPNMDVSEIEILGEQMQSIGISGVILPNNAGAPNLPGTSRFIAIPQGGWAEVELVEYRTEVFRNMNIAPAFEIPLETDDRPLQYRKDAAIYELDAYYPAQAIMVSEPTKMRGVDVVMVGITPFQYNPVTKELVVYTDLKVRVNFYGGNGHFGEDRLRSRWWEPIMQQNLLNYASLPAIDFNRRMRPSDDENVEYLIIVPDDPVFIAWADTLKRWRNEQGISTGITTLSEIGGNDYTLIENYINNAYYSWDPAPVAVLLLSD